MCFFFFSQNVNRDSNKDYYPVSSMEHILHIVFGSEMFSLLDGFWVYNQVLIAKPDRLKTTFWTKWGTFTFKRIPYRIINVETTFQRTMDIAFCGLIGQSLFIYLDDVTVFSKKRLDHVHHLKQIFEHFRKYGISVNSKKRVFGVFEGILLGQIIAKSGIKIDPKSFKAITQIHFW